MRLSPFDETLADSEWFHEAPLYGRAGLPNPHDQFSYEVFPAQPDEDVSEYQKIPRDKEKYEKQATEFDIPDANSGTEYVSVISTHGRPRLRWYTRSEFENRFLYDPLNPPRPRGVDPEEWERLAERRIRGRTDATFRLNKDRTKLLQRVARLWNGEVVSGVHLLADSCPAIKQLTADLDEEALQRLYYNTSLGRDVLLAFGTADWFESTTGILKPTSLFRKQAWYDLNHKGRLLINGNSAFPDLKGDSYEGLVHRITVGLVRLRDKVRGWTSASYYKKNGYVIDVFGRDSDRQPHAREVMTAHNNWKLYRKTYQKMKDLEERGVKPIAVFDSRETAYTVFNYWHRQGLADLPYGTFDSDYSVAEGRKQIQEAYESDDLNWGIADWTTTWKLKQETLGQSGPELNRNEITSISW